MTNPLTDEKYTYIERPAAVLVDHEDGETLGYIHVVKYQKEPGSMPILPVPFSSQHERDARKFGLDCGPACVEMVGEFLRGQVAGVGTDQIMQWITKGVNRSTTAAELNLAAQHFYQVNLTVKSDASWSFLRRTIDEGKPMIVLVNYGKFPMRMDMAYTSSHWMVVVGYDSFMWSNDVVERVIVHDPDWYGDFMSSGAFLPITRDMFEPMWYKNWTLVAEEAK